MNTPEEAVIQTTVRLTDDLHCRAKIEAATRRVTLNELFVTAIEKDLSDPKKPE